MPNPFIQAQDLLNNILTPEGAPIKLLVFILIFALSVTALRKIGLFKENKGLNILISIIISVLGMVYLTENLLKAAIIPYSVLGLVFLLGLPFLIIFLLTHRTKMPPTIRRWVWIIFGVVFIYLWWMNPPAGDSESYIYWIITALTALMIFADNSIHGIFKKNKTKTQESE